MSWGYHLIVWAGFFLAGLAADQLVRNEIRRSGAALGWAKFVGGCAFSFSAYHVMHLLGHLDLVATFWLPWFAVLFLRIARGEADGSVLRTALVLAGTAFTSWHYALYEILFAGVVVAHSILVGRAEWRRLLGRTLGVGALWALLVSPAGAHAGPGTGERWRWMGEESTLRVSVPGTGDYSLTLKARALDRPRRIAVSLDGSEAGSVEIAPDPMSTRSLVLALSPGVHRVELRSLDGADPPGGADPRRLSIALFEASIVKP